MNKLKLIKIGASWCGPCKALDKSIDESSEIKFLEYVKEDLDSMDPDYVQELKVRGVPTIILFNDNIEIQRKTGSMTSLQFDEWIKQGRNTTLTQG